jgi:hypothetical protein
MTPPEPPNKPPAGAFGSWLGLSPDQYEQLLDVLQADRTLLASVLDLLGAAVNLTRAEAQKAESLGSQYRRWLLRHVGRIEADLARTKQGGRKRGRNDERNDEWLAMLEAARDANRRRARPLSDQQLIERMRSDIARRSGMKPPAVTTIREAIAEALRRREKRDNPANG